MSPGDFILTPQWRWHDHGNRGGTGYLAGWSLIYRWSTISAAVLREDYSAVSSSSVARQVGDCSSRASAANMPLSRQPAGSSPIATTAYDRSREALHDPDLLLARPTSGTATRCALRQPGHRRLSDALDGRFPATVAEGSPRVAKPPTAPSTTWWKAADQVTIGEQTFIFRAKIVFVVPIRHGVCQFNASEECVLFSFSDRPAQEA